MSKKTLFEQTLKKPIGFTNWNWLSRHIEVTIEHVINNPKIPWSMDALSCNSKISMKDIEDNLHLGWNFWFVSYNINLTNEMIIKYPNENWNWEKIGALSMLNSNTIMNISQLKEYAIVNTCEDLYYESFEHNLIKTGFFDGDVNKIYHY